jgi:lysophospholipase L1-like esterase
MPASAPPPADWPTARRLAAGCEAGVVGAWVLLVLRNQYAVASLEPHEGAIDALFVAAVLGVMFFRAAARRGRTAAPVFAVRVAFRAAVIVAALVGAEDAARFAYREQRSSGNANDFVAVQAGKPDVVNNELGFRDREIPPKSPDRYRIAVVGDSFTWGQGLRAEERFSNVVGARLGPQFEVFNFGENGTTNHLTQLARMLPTSPDFVLLQLYITSFEMREMQRPTPYPLAPLAFDAELQQASMLYDLLSIQWTSLQSDLGLVERYDHYMARNLRNPNSPNARRSLDDLRAFIERVRQAGLPVAIMLFPAADAMGPNGSNYPFGYLHDRLRMFCADEEVPYLDLLPMYAKFKDPRTTWVSLFDAHPNAMTNQRVANEILAFLPLRPR